MHAPVIISLASGFIVEILTQRSRLCMIGGIRDFTFFRDTHLLSGFLAMLVTAAVGNLVLGSFNPGFAGQPVCQASVKMSP